MQGLRRERGFGTTPHVISGMAAIVPLGIAGSVLFPLLSKLDDRTQTIVGALMMVAFLLAALVAYLPGDPIAGFMVAVVVLAGAGAGVATGFAAAMTPESRAITGGVGAIVALPIAGVLLFVKNTIAEKLKPPPAGGA